MCVENNDCPREPRPRRVGGLIAGGDGTGVQGGGDSGLTLGVPVTGAPSIMCNVQQAEVAPRPGPPLCRSLFGPVDHAELSRELYGRLREMEEESSRRWDFDFQREVPLPSSRYVWEESGAETVPAFYRTPRCVRPRLSPQPAPRGSPGASERSLPAPTGSPGASERSLPAPTGSPGASERSLPAPDCTQPTASQRSLPGARAGANKRCQPAAQITDFFPVRKKTKVKALCDTLRSASPIPTEHTPRKLFR